MISWGDKRIGCRVLLLVLFLCWQQGECLAQFFSPRVRVSSSTVDEQSSRYFDKIEQRLTDLVFAFAPEVSCAAPKLPIDCELSLLISAVSGDRYTGDLRVRILRPVYGQQARSIVMQVGERGLTFDFSPYEPSLGRGSASLKMLFSDGSTIIFLSDRGCTMIVLEMKVAHLLFLTCQRILRTSMTSGPPTRSQTEA